MTDNLPPEISILQTLTELLLFAQLGASCQGQKKKSINVNFSPHAVEYNSETTV